MATTEFTNRDSASFLLELLHYAGWRLRVRGSGPATIYATRGEVEVKVTRATLSEAAGAIFARAMRSGRRAHGRRRHPPTNGRPSVHKGKETG